MDYSQWHSSKHDDEPADQERELRVPGHGYWASIGPDARQQPGGWSWAILEFDGTDNHDVANGFAGDEQAAKRAVDDWEAAAISSQPATPDSPVTFFLTYWLSTQYGMGLDAAQVAARLRDAGWADAAATADRIARREITCGDATDDGAVSVKDGAAAALQELARAIRRNEELLLPESGGGEPVDFGDPETYHVWIGRAQDKPATHRIAEHTAQHGHRCRWSGTPATCHLDGTVLWQCPAGCYTSIEQNPTGRAGPGEMASPAPDTGAMVRAIAERAGWSDANLAGLLIGYLEDQRVDDALRGYLEARATG